MRFYLLLSWVLPLVVFAEASFLTFPSDVDWVTQESRHFEIVYRRGRKAFARRTLEAAERAHQKISGIFPELPDKTWVVLADFRDQLNGYALDLPYPHMVLFAVPPDPESELASMGDWLESLVLHEYVHVLHLYPAKGFWSVLRFIFGSWVLPNGLQPGHFHEGLAVLLETELARGGRGTGATFEMYQRMAVEAGVWGTDAFLSRDQMDGSSQVWPHGTSRYFFGYQMYRELWRRKGRQGILDLVTSYSSNWPLAYNGPLEEVYGLDYESLWKVIYDRTRKESKKEITRIKQTPLSRLRYLTQSRFFKSHVTLSPKGKYLAYWRSHPDEGTALEIRHRRSGKLKQTAEENAGLGSSLCWLTLQGRPWLAFHRGVSQANYAHAQVHLYDPRKSTSVRVSGLKRVRQLACHPSEAQLLVYEQDGDKGEVKRVRLVQKEGDWKAESQASWKIPVGQWVSGLLSRKNKAPSDWIAVRDRDQTHLLRWTSGEPKRAQTVRAHLFGLRRSKSASSSIEMVADFDGRREVYAYAPGTNRFEKKVGLLGGVNSFDSLGKRYWVSSYRHGGYDIARAQSITVAKNHTSPTDRTPAETTPTLEEEDYSAWSTLFPRTWIPNLLFVPDGLQVGAWIPAFDIAQRHYIQLFGGYDTRGDGFANFSYTRRFGLTSSVGLDAFYLPSYLQSQKAFVKRWGGGVFLSTQTWLGIQVTPGFRIKRSEDSPLGIGNKALGVSLGLSKAMGFQYHPVAVAPTSGTKLFVHHAQYFEALGSDDNFFETTAGIDQYVAAPWWDTHVWALSARMGWTEGAPLQTSFYEGGGELAFHQGRGAFLNRGFLSGTFAARRILSLNLEYRFPIARVDRGWGYAPFFLKRLHGAVVNDWLTKDFGLSDPKDTLVFTRDQKFLKTIFKSVGFELASDWQFFYYVPTTIKLGFYHGFGPFGEPLYVTLGVTAGI